MDRATFALDNLSIKSKGDQMTLEELKAAIAKALADDGLTPDEMQALKNHMAELVGGKEANKEAGDEAGKAAKDEAGNEAGNEAAKDQGAEEKAEDESKAMDAKLKALEDKIKNLESTALDSKAVVKMINDKNALVSKLTPIIGAFDHSLMSEQEVAAYSVKKIGIACDTGEEVAALKGYLAAYSKPATTVDHGMDSKTTDADANKILSEMGIM